MRDTDNDLEKPMIGIANAWSTTVPGHHNLRKVSAAVREGIRAACRTPVEFGVIGGPMMGGPRIHGRKVDTTSIIEGVGRLKKDEISQEELIQMGDAFAPTCGSTNAALHIPAIAYEAGVAFDIKLFDDFSRSTPLIAKMIPATACHLGVSVSLQQAGRIR